jgi:protein TonB
MFREVLLESVPGRVRGAGVGFPLSVVAHGLVVATAIVLSAKGVEEPPEPAMPIIFQDSSPPPSGPSGSTARAAIPARRADDRPVVLHPAPLPIAASLPASATRSKDSTETPGMSLNNDGEDNGAGGDPTGVQGGTGRGPFTAEGGESEAAIPVGGDVRPPRLIERVEPVYPDAARTIRAQGLVILEAVITVGGRVEEVRVLRSPNPLLAASAVAAVEQWRYLPATLNRRPVKVFLTVTVDFKLH